MKSKMFKKIKSFLADRNNRINEQKLIKKMEVGFEKDEFKMHLQFLVDNKTKKIASAEALSRWENSLGEVVFPGEYIGLMEKSGLIIRFDYYMFEKVCKKLSQWKNSEFDNVTISCNITRITISEKGFVDKIKQIADKYDFDPSKLIVEITEDAIEKNMDVARSNVVKIKELGFSVALDDVGSGYASLINICEYPIDMVKVDREVLLLAEKESGKKLFLGIIDLIHSLNLEVVCEGVETEAQNLLATESGCDYVQGWYYSKALSESKAEEFYKEYMKKF